MGNVTRVLSKDDEFPSLEELADILQAEHPDFRLVLEEGGEEEWETLLIASRDGFEVALVERHTICEGSLGQEEIAEFIEETRDCRPQSGTDWLHGFLNEVRTLYAFQPLQGAETVEGSDALHGLRTALWERGSAILQADGEGFTNEEGCHIVWQFSHEVSGPWKMAVFKDDLWHSFMMDLGDPEHRAAFLDGEIPEDLNPALAAAPKQ